MIFYEFIVHGYNCCFGFVMVPFACRFWLLRPPLSQPSIRLLPLASSRSMPVPKAPGVEGAEHRGGGAGHAGDMANMAGIQVRPFG